MTKYREQHSSGPGVPIRLHWEEGIPALQMQGPDGEWYNICGMTDDGVMEIWEFTAELRDDFPSLHWEGKENTWRIMRDI